MTGPAPGRIEFRQTVGSHTAEDEDACRVNATRMPLLRTVVEKLPTSRRG